MILESGCIRSSVSRGISFLCRSGFGLIASIIGVAIVKSEEKRDLMAAPIAVITSQCSGISSVLLPPVDASL
jgi:hypothetical protein